MACYGDGESTINGLVKGDKKEVIIKDEISSAIDYAKKIVKKQDVICITGSLFTVGDAKDYFDK